MRCIFRSLVCMKTCTSVTASALQTVTNFSSGVSHGGRSIYKGRINIAMYTVKQFHHSSRPRFEVNMMRTLCYMPSPSSHFLEPHKISYLSFHPRNLSLKTQNFTPPQNRISHFSTKGTQNATISAVLKNQPGALQVKRPRKKMLKVSDDGGKTVQINNVVAYAVAEEIYLDKLERNLVKQGLYNMGKLPQDVTNSLHVRGKYNVEQKPKEIFVFEDGSVVFWSVPEVERGAFIKMLSKYLHSPYIQSLVWYEKEEMDFTYVNGKTSLNGDVIQLKEETKDSQNRLLELYTFSNALAQSVKLAMWEASFNNFVESIEKVTEDLRHGRKISMSRREVLMKTGELFSLRHLINLSSDLLDTPDFYWDRELLEPLYISLCNYLSISRRTKVINEKLNHCCEVTELLSSQLNDAHHTRLEIMIIVLILVEVVFEIIHSLERYLDKQVETTEPQTEQTTGHR